MKIDNDLFIIEEILNGNHIVFKEFYFSKDEQVYFYFLKKTRSSDIAKELTQLTFIKFWKYRKSLSFKYSVEIQLLSKARNVFIDWLRKEATIIKKKNAEQQYYSELHLSAETKTVENSSIRLQDALQQLPPTRKKVIELSHLHGYKYKEIAKLLNISVKTVDNHIYQALKQLRKYLSFLFL